MYAAYRVDGPSTHAVRSTTFTKNDDQLDESAIAGATFHGRIVSYCVAGTLGLLTPMYLQASSATANWSINQIEFEGAHAAAADTGASASKDIAHIRQVMKISVTELARTFGVSRQAVHEWINGGTLSPRNAQRLSDLAQAADVFLEAGIQITPQMLRRNVRNGQSLLESVKEDGKVVELARTLVDTLSREMRQRQRLADRFGERQEVTLPAYAFGASHLREDT